MSCRVHNANASNYKRPERGKEGVRVHLYLLDLDVYVSPVRQKRHHHITGTGPRF